MFDIKENLIIIKRDGREEPFQMEKLLKVINWATDNRESFTNFILKNFSIKITNKIKISYLYDELIKTTANMISPLYPVYDDVAKKLYVMKIYKEICNLKKSGEYPPLQDFINRGIRNKIYDKKVLMNFSKDEINELNKMIVPDRDFLFTYKGLRLMTSKYSRAIKGKPFELPQITYMMAAMYSFYNDIDKRNKKWNKKNKNNRLKYIKEFYDMLSKHEISLATPRIANSMLINAQLASCILNTPDDDTWSLNQTDGNMALYSKFSGGIAYDVSFIRSSGSIIQSNRGRSDGPIPFIKRTEQTISSFNQSGTRKGSCVITFPWWHMDVMDLVMLKDAGGTEDTRARKLMYCLKINEIFRKRVNKDEDITLFDPKDVPLLNKTWGKDFESIYINYENMIGIRKKKIKAKDLLFNALKVRQETGNLYLFFADNVNNQNLRNVYVGASNLCQEIVVPSSPSTLLSEKIYYINSKEAEIHTIKKSGEIGICNLVSINLVKWVEFSEKKKEEFMYNLLRGCDNIIDTQFYPVAEGEFSNKKNRPIGVGVTNYANLLASNKLKYTDKKAEQFTFDIFEDLYYWVYKISNKLAIERGSYATFKGDKWSSGMTPVKISRFDYRKFGLEFKNKKRWDELSISIKNHGVRFSLHAAIAPTATNGKVISATESIEPIVDLFFVEEGTYSLPSLAPNLKQNREYYERCWNIPPRVLIRLAAIRQMFIDQSQSINLYYTKPESAKELWDDIQYAMDLGVKTLYYMKTPKSNFELEEVCESCT